MEKKLILVAEDDENDALLLRRAFTQAGVSSLHFCDDGQQVIDFLTANAKGPFPALLVLDLKMPRLGGFEVLEWLRKNSKLTHLPVAILTSSTQASDIKQAYDLGANSYLVKPCDWEQLLDLASQLQNYWLKINQPPVLG